MLGQAYLDRIWGEKMSQKFSEGGIWECWSGSPLAYTGEMGYFGGLGAGKGWYFLNFLPDPELLGSLIDGPGLRFFRDDVQPRLNPWETRAGIIRSYRELLAAWTSHDSLTWHQALGNRFSVICPPTRVEFFAWPQS